MKQTFAIDFESYYDKNVSVVTMGAHHYFRGGGDVYLMSVASKDYRFVGEPKDFNWDILKGAHLIAHNYAFDGTALLHLQEIGVAPKDLDILGGDCTADMASYFQAPRNLKGASTTLLGDYVEMDKAMRNYMRGRRWVDLAADMKDKLMDYALKDAVVCYELWEKWSDKWPTSERRVSRHTREQAWRGMKVDTDLLEECLGNAQRINWEATEAIPWADSAPLLSRKAFNEECRRSGITPPASLAQADPAAAAWMAEHSTRFPWVSAVNEWRRTNTLISKLQAIKDRVREDGRITTELKYFGAATTGRWSGTGGVNFQNMPRGELFGVDMRKLFVADEGKTLLIADLNAIEPRCTAYITADTKLLEHLRTGQDVYQAYARVNLGYEGDDLKKDDPNLRALAKVALLSSAYGTGWQRLMESSKGLYGLDMTEEQARDIVDDYRYHNTHVTNTWHRMHHRMLKAAQQQGAVNMADGSGHLLATNGNDVTFPLVSGRSICLFNARSSQAGLTADQVKGDNKNIKWYGSKLFQNTVQATARDVFRDSILRVADAGMSSVLHIHDEIVVEADEGTDPRELASIMAVPPDWAKDLPVAAEGISTKHYTK